MTMVEHLVLFKLHEGTSEADKQKVVDTLQGLKEIPGIAEFSVGLNHSREGKSKGFEVGMRIGFKDQASLDAYLPSERHKSLIGQVNKHFADVIVLDYTW
ncbi:Dabb family protein [Paenibacillus piri]|uniref:Dabb family protein n=1 Tax=Paenibacillus piri TaxID=2547395 RepID=A0A4R5KIA2_9BACL|nr:Dabb family protein [Paenibacillus piri]TDF94488.1 Dabb family protein [Paenibacillus piri]